MVSDIDTLFSCLKIFHKSGYISDILPHIFVSPVYDANISEFLESM